jgi:hypothetical protein
MLLAKSQKCGKTWSLPLVESFQLAKQKQCVEQQQAMIILN